MSLEQSILNGIKRLPVEKRKAVLAFIESMSRDDIAVGKHEIRLSAQEQLENWNDWVQKGDQGPLEEDTPPEFP